MYSNVAKFCNYVNGQWKPSGSDWKMSQQTYDEGTLDEHTFSVNIIGSMESFDLAGCNKAFNSILDDCDGNDPKILMNWKFGGNFVSGQSTYSLSLASGNQV